MANDWVLKQELILVQKNEGNIVLPPPSPPGVAPSPTWEAPYIFQVYTETVAGKLFVENPIENSYTKGTIIGPGHPPVTYDLRSHQAEACAEYGLYRVCIQLLLKDARRGVIGRGCVIRIGGGWECSDWVDIVRM